MRDSFIFYSSFVNALDQLPEDIQLQLYKAITHYALFDENPALEGVSNVIFSLIKPQIDANNKKYEIGKKGAEYGKLGGRPKNQKPQKNPSGVLPKTPNEPPKNPTETPNVNVNVNGNGNGNGNISLSIEERENLKKYLLAKKKNIQDVDAYIRKLLDNGDITVILERAKKWQEKQQQKQESEGGNEENNVIEITPEEDAKIRQIQQKIRRKNYDREIATKNPNQKS